MCICIYIYIYSNQQKHYPAKISKIVGHCVSFFLGGGCDRFHTVFSA